MEDNVIQPFEYDLYVNYVKKFQINDIGTGDWFDSHEILIKFNQQAIIEATSHREELVKELLIINDKLEVLIHEAFCILVWRTKVLPMILAADIDSDSTFILYSILFHEAVSISLLEISLYHESGCAALGDASADLIDYCVQAIVQLIGLTHIKHFQENIDSKKLIKESMADEMDRQKKDLQYKIGLRCLTILSFITDKIEVLPISVLRRMVLTHDVPCLLSEILHCAPWLRNINGIEKYIDDKWMPVDGVDVLKVTKVEAQAWFCLRQLLFHREAMSIYEINDFRQRELSKCQVLLSVNVLDQLPPLVDLKHRLCTLTITSARDKCGSVLLEEMPKIKEEIMTEAKNVGYSNIVNVQIDRFFHPKSTFIFEMAKRLNNAYKFEFFEQMDEVKGKQSTAAQQHFCGECGGEAQKKCSKCEQTYYCSRDCQIKNWRAHKQICSVNQTK